MFNKLILIMITAVTIAVNSSNAQMLFDALGGGRYYTVQKSAGEYEIFNWMGTNKDNLVATAKSTDNVVELFNVNGTLMYTQKPTITGGEYFDAKGKRVAYFLFNDLDGINLYINGTLSYYTLPGMNNGISVFRASNEHFFNVIQNPPSIGANEGSYVLFSLAVMKMISL